MSTMWVADCRRCKKEVRVQRPWAGWKPLRVVWGIGTVIVVLALPLMIADLMVMTPSALIFLASGAMVHSEAKKPPRCRQCKLALPEESLREAPGASSVSEA